MKRRADLPLIVGGLILFLAAACGGTIDRVVDAGKAAPAAKVDNPKPETELAP